MGAINVEFYTDVGRTLDEPTESLERARSFSPMRSEQDLQESLPIRPD